MPPLRDRFCSSCGTQYSEPLAYPRRCAAHGCGLVVWANPIPVAVVLVPVRIDARTGLLVVRRGIEPGRGRLALAGGFVEAHETWQTAATREVREEVGIAIDPSSLRVFDCVSTVPRPDRVLLFSVAASVDAADFPPFVANDEASGRGVIFGPAGLDDSFAFTLHASAARRWFAEQGLDGDLALIER